MPSVGFGRSFFSLKPEEWQRVLQMQPAVQQEPGNRAAPALPLLSGGNPEGFSKAYLPILLLLLLFN